MSKSLQIMTPGHKTDMSGQPVRFSDDDLRRSAEAYDPQKYRAPLVIGHPKHDDLAYGHIAGLSFMDGALEGLPAKVDPQFADAVEAGRLLSLSGSFYHPESPSNPVPGVYYLRHVGFLGAAPPANKGMRAPDLSAFAQGKVEFADNETGIVHFGDYAHGYSADIFRRLRDWVLTKFGAEDADQIVPNWLIESLREAALIEPNSGPAFCDPPRITPQETTVTPEQKAAIEAENTRLKARVQELEQRDAGTAQETQHTQNLSFADGLVTGGRLPPKHKDVVVAWLDHSSGGEQTLEFGEGEAKQPLADAVKAFLSDLPQSVSFGETATKTAVAKDGPVNPLVADAERRSEHRTR
ncbi:hypothetical protein [Lysobacter sp. CA199]|uniref:hypothetical protein n=1 Tax=Lysobacter sp. CA199 TaxID=3455608 RepID=UPI003F8D0CC8